ncbi:SphA family protein [Ruegeria arenilitoris]|uniref:SphA family protein n=1 Tax=Ruegeria arenilitoris TaxID=1173585 RepID=UPI00147CE909|nr:transporter [Ruegeria arenilitoris]
MAPHVNDPVQKPRNLGSALSLLTSSLVAAAIGDVAQAAEGGGSHYLPGVLGDIFLALPPEPGFQVANVSWFQTGSLGTTLLEGQVGLDLDTDTFINMTSLAYTFEQPVLGGLYTIAMAVPFGYASLDGALTGPLGGQIPFSDDSLALSDIAFTPIQLNWNSGPWSFRFAETIIAPTGAYSTADADLVNLGRNYWSFDTVGAVTWFNPETGTEFSAAAGIMINTENSATDYKTGNEFHLDAVYNQFLSPELAVGLRGYYYQQLTADSGSGATLGAFKSSSYGIGPGFVWIPESAGGGLTILGKWMHDFGAENRFEADYVTLTAAWTF